MGVHSFWDIVGPTARPVRLESLEENRMAVDASIWIYQFLKAVRDNEGNAVKNAHIVGFFRRICKLLFFGIKPVFIFDGGVPVLKKETIKQRKEKRQGKRESAARTVRKLLALQLQKQTKNGTELDSKSRSPEKSKPSQSISNNLNSTVFKPHDEWDLPEIPGFQVYKGDERLVSAKCYEEFLNSFNDDFDGIDLDSINPASKEFADLPKATQYMILTRLRLRSRLRLGYSKEQLEEIFPNSIDFSKFQIDMVKRRNFFTQKLLNTTGAHDGGASTFEDNEVQNRISGQLNKEYKLSKTEHGWVLGFGDYDGSEVGKAIQLYDEEDLEKLKASYMQTSIIKIKHSSNETKDNTDHNDDEEDEDDFLQWEDVDLRPNGEQLIEDYSLRAAKLPQLKHRSIKAGSQSFLDKRYSDFSSPTKKSNNIKIRRVDDDDDDYIEHVKELEYIEAFQRSKVTDDQQTREVTTTTNSNDIKSQEQLVQKSTAKSIPKMNNNKEKSEVTIDQSKKNKTINVLTGSEQSLDFIISKIPGFENNDLGQSFLFNNSGITNEKGSSKNAINDTPSWFEVSNSPTKNAYGSNNFVPDKIELNEDKEEDSKKGYFLFSGLEADEFLRNHKINNNYQYDSKHVEENSVEIIEENYEIRNESQKVDIVNVNNPLKSSDPSKDFLDEDATPGSEPEINQDQVQRKPSVFQYDFSEDEESYINQNIRKEGHEFNVFKSTLNDKQPAEGFLEDELFEQQLKDKRDSDEVTQEMIVDVQDLLSRFGIPYITAPMEAEAQCAKLLELKLVDGIITDDSDVFLFGGSKIYKNMFHQRNYVEFYDSNAILKGLGLDRINLIDLAQLLGSDYTNGIKGMGPVSSMEILAEFGSLEKFRDWYNQGQFKRKAQEEANKFERDLRKRLVKNEVILDSDFPSKLVKDAYLNPEVEHDETPFVWGNPDLDMLRVFMRKHIGWSQEKSDEVLIPLIRDINMKKKKKGKQRTLSEFFPNEVIQEGKKLNLGKRIVTATGKIKQRRLK